MPGTLTVANSSNRLAAEALVEALETMAFITAMPADPGVDAPSSAWVIRMPFRGPFRGVVEMVAPPGLGALLASNLFGPDADPSASLDRSMDALKELLNITCGLLFRKLRTPQAAFDIGLPELCKFDATAEWGPFVSRAGASVLDAEDNLVAIHVKAGGPA